MKNILILNFSARNTGNCEAIARYISEHHSNQNVCVNKYFVHLLPCSGCDYECLRIGSSCPAVTEEQRLIMNAIIDSDLVYFIIPNFCGFPCSNYFTFNERSVGFFNMDRELMKRYMDVKKRFVIVSNTESNTFVQAMRQQDSVEPEILYLKTSKYKKNSIAGDILTSDTAKAELTAFLEKELAL